MGKKDRENKCKFQMWKLLRKHDLQFHLEAENSISPTVTNNQNMHLYVLFNLCKDAMCSWATHPHIRYSFQHRLRKLKFKVLIPPTFSVVHTSHCINWFHYMPHKANTCLLWMQHTCENEHLENATYIKNLNSANIKRLIRQTSAVPSAPIRN